jgi:SagB-type dehydrogenase family enzyme
VIKVGPVEVIHRSTCHGERPYAAERLVQFRKLDPTNRPAPFKRYPDIEAMELPRQLVASSLPATRVLAGKLGESSPLDLNLLGSILFLAAGVSRVRNGNEPISSHRTAMSAGNLHPTEIYVLHEGLWHYQPLEHALVPLRPASEAGGGAGALLVLTGIPWRTCWKYRERGWRHLFWDAGTMAANVLEVAAAHGVPARVEYGFDDDAVSQLAGLVPEEELPVVLIRLGADDVVVPQAGSLPTLDAEVNPIAPHPIRFPLLEEAHAAGNLTGTELDEWRRSAARFLRHSHQSAGRAAMSGSGESTIEEVVLQRGSTRAFVEKAGSGDLLEWSLAAATRSVPSDVGSGGTFLGHYLSIHAIDDQPSGRARWREPSGLEWLGRAASPSEERALSAHLCLDQKLGGSSAYTAFHCCDVAPFFHHEAGARAYRAAQLEAGVVAGRLALCAFALDAGATGLTFFDHEVSTQFGTPETPMLATAIGIRVGSPVRGGSPGNPAALRPRTVRHR